MYPFNQTSDCLLQCFVIWRNFYLIILLLTRCNRASGYGGTHVQEVMCSNPGAIYWMDMPFFTLICCKNCIVCLKRPKLNQKRPGLADFKNSLQLNCNLTPFISFVRVVTLKFIIESFPRKAFFYSGFDLTLADFYLMKSAKF